MINQEDIAKILNKINDALEDTNYIAVGYDNTEEPLKILIEEK